MAPPRQLLKELLLLVASPQQPLQQLQQQQQPAAARAELERAAAIAMAVACLPRLLAAYTKQQLAQGQPAAVAVVAGQPPPPPPAASGTAPADVDRAAAAGAPALLVASAAELAHSADGEGPVLLRRPSLAIAAVPAAGPAQLLLAAEEEEAREQAAPLSAWSLDSTKRMSLEDAQALLPRHRSADVVGVLLSPAVVQPLLDALQARLGAMSRKQLLGCLRALALLRLAPGKALLQAHLQALRGRVVGAARGLDAKQKVWVGAAYCILARDPACLAVSSSGGGGGGGNSASVGGASVGGGPGAGGGARR